MAFKVLMALVAVVVAGVAYMLSRPINPAVSEPWKVRSLGSLFGFSFLAGILGEKLGLGSRMNITRYFADRVISVASPAVDPQNLLREDTLFDGVPVRVYRPTKSKTSSPRAGMVFYHGGGWILGSVASHDLVAAHYAVEANMVVVSVEYRMAPEFPYPVPLDDCVMATKYFIQNAAKFNVDPNRVAIGGDSAGGNLAAAVSLKLRDTGFRPMPKAQVLMYPVMQLMDFNTPSFFRALKYQGDNSVMGMMVGYYLEIPKEYHPSIAHNRHISPELRKRYGPYLKMEALPEGFVPEDYKPTDVNLNWDNTVPTKLGLAVTDRYVSPLLADDLTKLPEAFVLTIGSDALRDEGAMFAYRLKEAGVKSTWIDIPDAFHGCASATDGPLGTKSGRRANEAIVRFLKENV